MKWLLAIALLFPTVAWANNDCSTERIIIKTIQPDGRELVNEETRLVCKNKKKEVFSDCKKFQWDNPWGGTGNSISCDEWSEQDATTAALTYANDGVKLEWIDPKRKYKGSIIAWTFPRSQEGWCRHIFLTKDYGSSSDTTNRVMCYSEGRGWQYWRR